MVALRMTMLRRVISSFALASSFALGWAFLVRPSVAVAAQPSGPPIAARTHQPVEVRPTTVVVHPEALAGFRVVVPAARVVRIVGPRLVVVAEPHMFRFPIVRPELEELLLALPSSTDLAVGEVIRIVGSVRTIPGLAYEHGRNWVGEIDPVLNSRRYRGATLLVAETAQSLDDGNLK